MSAARLITALAPVRVCDCGGWTDTWFAGHGRVFSVAVSPHVEVQIAATPAGGERGRIEIHAENFRERFEPAPGPPWGSHPLLEAAIAHVGVPAELALVIWNAEGVELVQQGVPTREFRVDEFGAPRYPELIVAAAQPAGLLAPDDPICRFVLGLEGGYSALADDPGAALGDLLEAAPESDEESQRAQLAALVAADAFSLADEKSPQAAPVGEPTSVLDRGGASRWLEWAAANGIVEPAKVRQVGSGLRSSAHSECDLRPLDPG